MQKRYKLDSIQLLEQTTAFIIQPLVPNISMSAELQSYWHLTGTKGAPSAPLKAPRCLIKYVKNKRCFWGKNPNLLTNVNVVPFSTPIYGYP